MKLFSIIFIGVFLLLSCNSSNTLKKSITTDYKEVFYGYNLKMYGDSVFQLFPKDISVGFNIPGIEKSPALNEIRVYCTGPFNHRFFRQQVFPNDSLILDMYMCYMKTSNDSSYFLIKDHIVLSGKYDGNTPYPVNDFPDRLTQLKTDDAADGPAAYFVEVKKDGKIKSDFSQKDIYKSYDGDEKFIYSLLQQIEKDYTFRFDDEFDKITLTFGSKLLSVK
jgi:hypothetical protein